MEQAHKHHEGHKHDDNYMSDDEIAQTFIEKSIFPTATDDQRKTIHNWFKETDDPRTLPHHGDLGDGIECNQLVDKWMEWSITLSGKVNPIAMSGTGYMPGALSAENAVFFRSGNTKAYFAAAAPFHNPDVVRITITEDAPVLFPVYFAETSAQENPSLSEDQRVQLIKKDLAGIYELSATLDRKEIFGCCVFRKKPLIIPNIPKDNIFGIPADELISNNNSVQLLHGGLWLLLGPDVLDSGDHLVHYLSKSVNYEIEAKILISVLR